MTASAVTTILFTDLVDSTGLLDRLGDDAAHRASRDHLGLLRTAVAAHGGEEIKSLGDGIMAAFPSAVAALRCAVEMQQQVLALTPGTGLRVGLDAGEPIVEPDDMFGTPVVVARRLCDLSHGGQILISDLVHSLVGRRVDHSMARLGPIQVKGLSTPVDTWSVRWDTSRDDAQAPPPARRTSVLIADDQRLVRAGFRVILEAEPDLNVVGEAADGVEAVEMVRRLAPDVVLMDIRMPRMNGLEAARELIANTASRIVMLTTFDADEYIYETLRIGASGFLLKDSPPEQLVSAIRSAASGDALIDPTVTKRLIGFFSQARATPQETAETPGDLAGLTARELDVLRLVARGLSNAEIAAELVVEESTVKSHVAHILTKLQIRDRVQAVVKAYECGFVPRG